MAKLIKVRFLKSPTGKPWFMAYSVGAFGMCPETTAEEMATAGVCEIVSIAKVGAVKAPLSVKGGIEGKEAIVPTRLSTQTKKRRPKGKK